MWQEERHRRIRDQLMAFGQISVDRVTEEFGVSRETVRRDLMDIGLIVTDLCVMDFGGPDRAVQVRSVHPGVSFERVQENTGFPLLKACDFKQTVAPSAEQLALIRRLDPHDYRAAALKGNPPGIRQP